MNQYLKNLKRLEFFVTVACTGKCKHCSEGEHINNGQHIDGDVAADIVRKVCSRHNIKSIMTFGGEALLYLDVVCKIHSEAKKMKVEKRQLITNGFFSNNEDIIKKTTMQLAESGVNDILLSVDAFHQETIPVEYVKVFAKSIAEKGIRIRTQPAWLVSEKDQNPYNIKTEELLKEFDKIGIPRNSGNVIFPSGNALKYLSEYFNGDEIPSSPYDENPRDMRAISISPNGDLLGENVYEMDVLDILDNYEPDIEVIL